MTPFQVKMWKKMIQWVQDFEHGKLPFHRLVGNLEWALDSSRIQDQELSRSWYEYWTPLEEFELEKSSELEVDYAEIQPAVGTMKTFLVEQLRFGIGPGHPHSGRKFAHATA